MPHRLRDRAAGTFHVYTHCVWATRSLYRDDTDRLTALRHLARVTSTIGWTCVAFCLLGSHYHLILVVEDDVLPAGMHRLNLGYARDFNRRHGLRGHVQFKQYGASRIHSDEELLDRFAYLAWNPVEAGLCDRPEDWPWSSYAGTVGLAEPHSFVDDALLFASFSGPDVRAQLRHYVEEWRKLP